MRKLLILCLILLFSPAAALAVSYQGEYDYFHAFSKDGNYALFSRISVNEGFNRLLVYSAGQKVPEKEFRALDLGLVGERESVIFDKTVLALPQIKTYGFEDYGSSGVVSPSGKYTVSFDLKVNEAQYLSEETGQWIPSYTGILKIILNDKVINELSMGNWDTKEVSEERINKVKVHWNSNESTVAFSGFLVTNPGFETKDYYPVSFVFPLKSSNLPLLIEQKVKEKLNENLKLEILRIDEAGERFLVKVYLKKMKKLGKEEAEVFYDVIKEYVYSTVDGKLVDKEGY